MTYQRKQPKAPWYRALHGDTRKPKQRKPVRRVSKAMSKRLAKYYARVKVWKKGRKCIGGSLKLLILGRDIPCPPRCHDCQDCHHAKGKPGTLLMDERFWIPVCRPLHSWLRDRPKEARALGLYDGAWQHVPKENLDGVIEGVKGSPHVESRSERPEPHLKTSNALSEVPRIL